MDNTIRLTNISNETIDLNEYLDFAKSLFIKNCYNLKILIKNKINKINIENSNQVYIQVNNLIAGLEISNSKYIIIESSNSLPNLQLFKSTVFICGESIKQTYIISELSELYQIERL